ncbi:MAG: hypothetical protein QM581_07230 [Pseudomonas sp.]
MPDPDTLRQPRHTITLDGDFAPHRHHQRRGTESATGDIMSTPTQVPPPASPQVVHHYYVPAKSGGTAALLEILPGLLFQTFGIGHIYAGNVGTGLIFMFGYWLLLAANVLLMFVLIGFATAPLCWIAAMIISSITAANACKPSPFQTTTPGNRSSP